MLHVRRLLATDLLANAVNLRPGMMVTCRYMSRKTGLLHMQPNWRMHSSSC